MAAIIHPVRMSLNSTVMINIHIGVHSHQSLRLFLVCLPVLKLFIAGIDGVGPVKALEIMKEFPGQGIESLLQFKQWWQLAHKQVVKIL